MSTRSQSDDEIACLQQEEEECTHESTCRIQEAKEKKAWQEAEKCKEARQRIEEETLDFQLQILIHVVVALKIIQAKAEALAREATEDQAAAVNAAKEVTGKKQAAAERNIEEARVVKEAGEDNAKSHEQKDNAPVSQRTLQVATPAKADANMQKAIKKALDKLPVETRCDQRHAWVSTETGYQCEGGGHFVTFEQLAAA
ncbi:hypothetical protein BS17DRAFT_815620 [Gyrodon lividus]|nr:hypothetical protein BS17DRAFT_815620 [Gyrodon lividus]